MDPAGCPFEEVKSTGARERECESSRKVTEARIVGESKCDGPRDGVTRRDVEAMSAESRKSRVEDGRESEREDRGYKLIRRGISATSRILNT